MSESYPAGVKVFDGANGGFDSGLIRCPSRFKRFEITCTSCGLLLVHGYPGFGTDEPVLFSTTATAGAYDDTDPWPFVKITGFAAVNLFLYLVFGGGDD